MKRSDVEIVIGILEEYRLSKFMFYENSDDCSQESYDHGYVDALDGAIQLIKRLLLQ